MYEKAEEDAVESQLQERATLFAQELVKVSRAFCAMLLEISRDRLCDNFDQFHDFFRNFSRKSDRKKNGTSSVC